MTDTLLSILICGLPDRNKKFFNLLENLNAQIIKQDDNVELLYLLDIGEKKSGLTTGAKRNKLLDAAIGKYVCFVDDDDQISDNYVSLICNALKPNDVDCLGIEGVMRGPTGVEAIFKHSIEHTTWHDDGKIYYRCPNHLNPVRSEIAKKVRFAEITFGEDADYSKRLLPHLSTEIKIEGVPLYFYLTNYRFDPQPTPPQRSLKIRRFLRKTL